MPFRLRHLLPLLFAVCFGQSLHAKQTDSTSTHYPRTVVYEEGTGTWCGWCPLGGFLLDELGRQHPDRFVASPCIAMTKWQLTPTTPEFSRFSHGTH